MVSMVVDGPAHEFVQAGGQGRVKVKHAKLRRLGVVISCFKDRQGVRLA